jgi:hypothetical protein
MSPKLFCVCQGGGGGTFLTGFFPLTTSKGKIRFQALRISRMLLVIRWTDDKPKAFGERGGCKEKLVFIESPKICFGQNHEFKIFVSIKTPTICLDQKFVTDQ